MDDIWIFGYGSLMWKTGFPFESSRLSYIDGWSRRFWQRSTDHRGTPEFPGRVVTLVPDRNATCWGMAYRLPRAEADNILAALDYREKNGYVRLTLDVRTVDGEHLRGLTYYADEHNLEYLGHAPLPEIARQIMHSAGPSGTNKAYILALNDTLLAHDIEDPHVSEITRLILEKHQP